MGRDDSDIDDKDALMLGEDHEDAADDEFEARAGHAQRGCTDVMCLIIFWVVLFGGMTFVLQYAQENGDMRRLYHGYNYLGQLCGVDTDSNGTALGEYLYYCPNALSVSQLDLKHPICVKSCPDGTGTTNCVQMPPEVVTSAGLDAAGTFQSTYTYRKSAVPDYSSRVWGHRYCMPNDNLLLKQITSQMEGDWTSRFTMKAGQIAGAYTALLTSAILAFILGFAFLIVVNYCAWPITIMCMVILCFAPLIAGGYFVHVGYNGGFDNVPSTGDSQWDKIVGFSLIAIGIAFTLLSFCCAKAVRTAVAVIQCACDCIFSLPSLLLEPVINVIFKSIVMVTMVIGLAWLMSCGTVQKVSVQEYAMSEMPGSELSGVFRTFHYTENEKYYLLYYIFMIFWIMELFTALGQFVVSYAVQLWYFSPNVDGSKEDVPNCPVLSGYAAGLFYHSGSLAFGSFLVATTRLVRLLLAYFAQQTRAAGGENAATACCIKICSCCLLCFQKFIEFLNKNAYMDIAITSSNFCPAARRAFKIIFSNVDTIAVLNGACWVIQWAGLGAIVSACSYLTWLMLRHVSTFSDSTSDHFVDDPILVTIVSGLISAYIARAFLHVFDTVADCILYCYCIEDMRRRAGQYQYDEPYAPGALAVLMSEF